MGRMWAMGCSATNASSDLSQQAARHAAMREGMIELEAKTLHENSGRPYEECLAKVKDTVDSARRRIRLSGGEQQPNLADHGVAAPVTIGGETYSTTGVHYERGGDRIIEAVRPLGGGRFATKRITMRVDGGERTRVVTEVRGG